MAGAVLALMLLSRPGAGLTASLLFGFLGMAPAGVILALAGQAVPLERRAFGMGVFFTVHYTIITASPPIVGRLLDRAGAPDGAILFWALLLAPVFPVALLIQMLQTRVMGVPVKETV
jgi:hypothetical protein